MGHLSKTTTIERAYQILIVDDDEMLQRFYADVLTHSSSSRCTIYEANTGAAGLAALQSNRFDCVLLDFRLPDMSGIEFLTHAAVDGLLPCGFVLVTGQGSEAVAVEAMKRGARDYLVKGQMDPRGLWRAIQHAVAETELRAQLALSAREIEARNVELERLNDLISRSEMRFRQVVEAAPNAMIMINAAGEIVLVNSLAEELFGYTRSELLGAPIERLVPSRLRARHRQFREQFLTDLVLRHKAGGRALLGLRKDGREIELEIALNHIETEEGMMVLSAIVDISARVRLEAELRQAQKMQILGRLSAGVGHDFNNILQVIFGGVDGLLIEPSLPATAGVFISQIENAAKRAQSLTHQLLAYSRKQMLTLKLVDLELTLDRMGAVLTRTLASNIALRIDKMAAPARVRTDPGQLETALMNLAINAAHAMPEGGSLSFAVGLSSAVPFEGLAPGQYAVISVVDTGIGMTQEVQECAFDPFFTTKGSDGTGLGLAMVQGFCRQVGGDVRVTSTLGRGTRFEVWLPTAEAEIGPVEPVARPAKRAFAGRVLVVDDTLDVLVVVEQFLCRAGFAVRCATGGVEALATLAGRTTFDLLICDYMMPEMNGVELIRQVRETQPHMPALIISGYADVADFMTGLPNAAMLRKPFQAHELVDKVSVLVGRASDHRSSQQI